MRVVRENIAGVRVIKALSEGDYERRHFENANRQMMEREQKAALNMAFLRPTMNMVLNLGLVLVIAAGALRVNAGTSEVGKIMAFLSYFTIILNAMLSITRVLTMYSKASASAARIVEVLDAPPDLEPQPLPPTPGTARIRFEDVSFSYQKKELDLSHISFALEPGETLGIIGPTGAGKSTIVSLLLRLYDADSGRILVDGRDVRSYPLHDLRQKFGVVFQNDALFADSVARTSAWAGRSPWSRSARRPESAQADFIKGAQGRGFQGDVAIKGANLSGGQKQRLLIARALAGSPEILLLDDSSSALDYKTDAALRRQIRSRYRATCVIVAQRDQLHPPCGTHPGFGRGALPGVRHPRRTAARLPPLPRDLPDPDGGRQHPCPGRRRPTCRAPITPSPPMAVPPLPAPKSRCTSGRP